MSNADKAAGGKLQSPVEKESASAQLSDSNSGHPTENAQRILAGPLRWLALCGAAGCLFLAVLGVVLPGLPTTPFLLLASYLLLRTSPTLHHRLTSSHYFGPLIRNWETSRAITLRTKMWALTVVICSLIYTLIAVPMPTPLKIVTGTLGAMGITVIFRLRVLPRSEIQ